MTSDYASIFSASLMIFLIFFVSAANVVGFTDAQTAYIPPFSIYGTPTPPSDQATLNLTGEYWGPYVNTVYWTWFTTSQAIIEALVNGYIQDDMAGVGNIQQYNQIQQYVKSGQIALNITPANEWNWLGFNVHEYPFSNVHFRRALQHLVNYATITSALDNGILGIATPYYFLPSIFGKYFTPQLVQAYQKYGAYNLSAAVQELEAAGLVDHSAQGYWSYSNGTKASFTVIIVTGPGEELELAELSGLTSSAPLINLSITTEAVNPTTFGTQILPNKEYQMFLGEWIWSPPSPTELYMFLGPTAINSIVQNYTDPVAWNLLQKLEFDSSTPQLALNYTAQASAYLQSQLPYITLFFGTTLVPINVQNWRGYTIEPPFTPITLDLHPSNSTVGSFYRIGYGAGPDTLNPYTYLAAIDDYIFGAQYVSPLQIALNSSVDYFPWAAYNYSVTASSGLMPNGEPYNGTVITFNFLHDITWADGVPLTAEDYNFTLWYFDVGGFTHDPYNPSIDTIEYSPGITLNYTAEANYPSLVWYDGAPGMVGTYVPPNNPYQLQIYFNTSSIFNLYNIFGFPTIPEHTLAHVSPVQMSQESSPQQYLPQYVPASGYMFESWSPSASFTAQLRNPSYFLTNPYVNQITATTGSTAQFSVTVKTYNTSQIISNSTGYFAIYNPVNNAAATLYVANFNSMQILQTVQMQNTGPGVYTATINTANLQPGSYLLLAQVNWTGAPYYFYSGNGSTTANSYNFHEYGVLTVTSSTSPSTTQTPTSPTLTTTTSFSTTPSTTTTTQSSSTSTIAIVVILVVIVIAALAAVAVTRRKRTS
jgi:ABC-type transport system substrate-binding protein